MFVGDLFNTSIKYLEWLKCRSMNVSHLLVYNDFSASTSRDFKDNLCKVKVLRLTQVTKTSTEALVEFLGHCSKTLQELTVVEGNVIIDTSVLHALVKCDHLTSLKLHKIALNIDYVSLVEVKGFKQLKVLHIHTPFNNLDGMIRRFTTSSPLVTELVASQAPHISFNSCELIAKAWSELQVCDLRGCEVVAEGLTAIVKSCMMLRLLGVNQRHNSMQGFKWSTLYTLLHLRVLHVVCDRQIQIAEIGVSVFLNPAFMRQLEELTVQVREDRSARHTLIGPGSLNVLELVKGNLQHRAAAENNMSFAKWCAANMETCSTLIHLFLSFECCSFDLVPK